MKFIFLFLILLAPVAYAGEFQIKSGSDILGINESIGDVAGSLDETKLPPLKSGSINTLKGTTKYEQYIRFKDTTTAIQSGKVQYLRDDGLEAYFHSIKGSAVTDALFEYELKFNEGLKSAIKNGKLDSLDGIKVNIIGEEFVILNTKVDTATKSVELNFLRNANTGSLKESESKIFSINGKQYNIEVVTITNANPNEVVMKVDGQQITVDEGEIRNLGSVLVAVSKALVGENNQNDVADIYVGAENIKLKDTNYEDDSFTQGLELKSNLVSEGYVKIKGAVEGTDFKINDVFYRLTSRSKSGDDIYLKESEKLSENIAEKSALLSDRWDLQYRGLSDPGNTVFEINPSGDTLYDIEFTNKDGNTYQFPFVSFINSFKLGDDNQDLVFVEGSSSSDYNINLNDYFVVTTSNTKTGTSGVIKYKSFDITNSKIYLEDLEEGEITAPFGTTNVTNGIGEGFFTFAGQNYRFYVKNDSVGNYSISVDQNRDGSINAGEAKIILKGGGILDLGSTNTPSDDFAMTLTTGSGDFDEPPSSDEVITINIDKRSSQVGISSITGVPLISSGQHSSIISDYGVLVDLGEKNNGSETLTIKYPISQVSANLYLIYNETNTIILETCFDKIKNQNEEGIDCGGFCAACVIENKTSEINTTNQTVQIAASTCDGCEKSGICYKIGDVIGVQYCSPDNEFKFKKNPGEICAFNYQCLSSICEGGKCTKAKGETNYLLIIINLIVISLIAAFLVHFYKANKGKETKPL